MNKIYSRLAFTNIKNNKTLYMPYIISGMVMIAMFYVMMFLNNSKGLGKVPGAEILVDIMGLGCGIIAIFSYIFLFYTNSFIIKRRKKELGIYNILGMEKRHIARVLSIETLTVALAAIASGIIAGILFSKLMIMFLYRIINIKAQINFTVSTTVDIVNLYTFPLLSKILIVSDSTLPKVFIFKIYIAENLKFPGKNIVFITFPPCFLSLNLTTPALLLISISP